MKTEGKDSVTAGAYGRCGAGAVGLESVDGVCRLSEPNTKIPHRPTNAADEWGTRGTPEVMCNTASQTFSVRGLAQIGLPLPS
jgi:hypothetical protein